VKRLLVLAVFLTACSSGSGAPTQKRAIRVFAASSLTKAFTGMARAFTESHPGLKVELSFAGSQSLAAQVREGAQADVLATADVATATSVARQLNGTPVVFAHNALALVTPTDNPAHVGSLADLGRQGVKVVLAGPTVPVGKAAAKALKAAHVTVRPVSLEDNVNGVVTKVRLGEADAGIAYVTDLVGAEGIAGTPLPGTTTDLAIAPLAGITAPDDADAFIAFVRSATGVKIMESWGFT
jgi:molybdate transport system substrate-binding protein